MAKGRLALPMLLCAAVLVASAAPAAAAGNSPAAHRCVQRNDPGRARGHCARFGAQSHPTVIAGACIALEGGGWSQVVTWTGFIAVDAGTPLLLEVYDNGSFVQQLDLTGWSSDGLIELGIGTLDPETGSWIPPTGTWTFVLSDVIDGSESASIDASTACPPALPTP